MIVEGIQADIPLCQIVQSGSDVLSGASITTDVFTIQNYGTNKWWESIPLEFLRADGTSPPIEVTVDGIPALCTSLDCGYRYVQSANELITLQTISGRFLTLEGVDLPLSPVLIEVGDTECIPGSIVSDGTMVTCELENDPQAGDWDVNLQGSLGSVPIESTVP